MFCGDEPTLAIAVNLLDPVEGELSTRKPGGVWPAMRVREAKRIETAALSPWLWLLAIAATIGAWLALGGKRT